MKVDPSVEADRASVSFRAPQAAGSCSTTRLADGDEPTSTCTHCGNALLALSQYEPWLRSVTFDDGYTSFGAESLVGRPAGRFVGVLPVPVRERDRVMGDAFPVIDTDPVR